MTANRSLLLSLAGLGACGSGDDPAAAIAPADAVSGTTGAGAVPSALDDEESSASTEARSETTPAGVAGVLLPGSGAGARRLAVDGANVSGSFTMSSAGSDRPYSDEVEVTADFRC